MHAHTSVAAGMQGATKAMAAMSKVRFPMSHKSTFSPSLYIDMDGLIYQLQFLRSSRCGKNINPTGILVFRTCSVV